MKRLIGLIALFGFYSVVQASDSFIVNAKIFENKNLVSSPTLVVNSNEEVSITVDDLYSFALTLTPVDESTIRLVTDLEIGGEHISPSLMVELGVVGQMCAAA